MRCKSRLCCWSGLYLTLKIQYAQALFYIKRKHGGSSPDFFSCYPPMVSISSFLSVSSTCQIPQGNHLQLRQPKLEFFSFSFFLCLLFLPTCFLFFCQIALDKIPLKRIIRKKAEQKVFSLNTGFVSANQKVSMFRQLCKFQSQHKHWRLIILHFGIQAPVSYGWRAFLADRILVEEILKFSKD